MTTTRLLTPVLPDLVTRRHIDLARVFSTSCR
jgi:hypothetical protein